MNPSQECFHGFFSDFATRHIDDASQADGIVRIEKEAKVREDVLNLLAFVEPDSPIDFVWDPRSNE